MALRKAMIIVTPSKCFIGYKELECLAHQLGNGTIKPSATKVQAIERLNRPKTKKQVRSFIGTMNFYRRYIPHFASTAATLTDLTRKSTPNNIKWNEEHEVPFIKLNDALMNVVLLVNPDCEKNFVLQTDASDKGYGAVLLQKLMEGYQSLSSAENATRLTWHTVR